MPALHRPRRSETSSASACCCGVESTSARRAPSRSTSSGRNSIAPPIISESGQFAELIVDDRDPDHYFVATAFERADGIVFDDAPPLKDLYWKPPLFRDLGRLSPTAWQEAHGAERERERKHPIYAVTGATISSRAITQGVRATILHFRKRWERIAPYLEPDAREASR